MKHNFFKSLLLVVMTVVCVNGFAAWSFSGGTMYFDNSQTKWSKAKMMLIIGKGTSGDASWSSVYEMSKQDGDLWSVALPSSGWGDATYMAVINGDSKWGDGKWGTDNLKNANGGYSAAYTSGLDSNGLTYIFTPENGNNGCTLVLTQYTPGGGGGGGGSCDPAVDADKWYLRGTFNDWDITTELKTKSGGAANTLYATLSFEAGKEHQFKLFNACKWYGNDGTMTQYHHTDWGFEEGKDDCYLATNIAGDYEFAFNTSTKAVTVTYPNNPKQAKKYETAVPEKNGDVMIQAFYWAHDGNTGTPYKEYGSVDWSDLKNEAGDLAKFFDLVWLAPSQETADYTGYLPMNYSNQGIAEDKQYHHGHSPWGTAQDLRQLIDNLHQGGAKVIADIVLNHTSAGHVDEYDGSDKNWCDWTENDFGRYGKFTPLWSWITVSDEMYATDHMDGRIDAGVTGACGEHKGDASLGEDDTSIKYDDKTIAWDYQEYNSIYSRDLSHNKKEVREFSRAYLTWMRDSIGYDGFRWDFMKGISGQHLFDYLRASAPCFSVAEVFEGDLEKNVGFLKSANEATYVFDFPGKFSVYNAAIREYKLQDLKGFSGKDYKPLIFNGNKRNAVTFIDNHDSFREGSNLYGEPNKMDDRQARMALAYLMSMPGVPCVLYPYWYNHKEECMAFIKARKSAGVHSESEVVSEWAGSGSSGDNYYTAMIKGEKGYIFLKLGYDCIPTDAPMEASPDGKEWKCAWANRDHAGVWYTGDEWTPSPGTDITNEGVNELTNERVTKVIRNGVLYIQRGDAVYNVQGLRIK